MAHFLIEYREMGNAEARDAKRAEHVAYRKGFGTAMPLTGPLLDDDERVIGSLIIVEAPDRPTAEAIAMADPYVAAAVLELVSIRRYRIAAMKPPPDGA